MSQRLQISKFCTESSRSYSNLTTSVTINHNPLFQKRPFLSPLLGLDICSIWSLSTYPWTLPIQVTNQAISHISPSLPTPTLHPYCLWHTSTLYRVTPNHLHSYTPCNLLNWEMISNDRKCPLTYLFSLYDNGLGGDTVSLTGEGDRHFDSMYGLSSISISNWILISVLGNRRRQLNKNQNQSFIQIMKREFEHEQRKK